MKKTLAMILAIVMCLSLLAACGGAKEEAPAEAPKADAPAAEAPAAEAPAAEAAAKDTLVVGISTEPTTLNPADASLLYNDAVLRLVYDTLIRIDEDMNYLPHLAESYEAVSDTEWKFVLREGLVFSDGTPVTPADVQASIEAVNKSAAVGSFAAWYKDVEIIDDRTFVIVTNSPSERILYDLAQYSFVVPKKLLDEGYNFSEGPIGTGPYHLVEWKLGDRLVFKANEDYFLPEDKAAIPNLIWRIMPEGLSRTIALENGEVDFLYDVQPTDLQRLEENPDITVYTTPYASPFYLCFNLNKPAMSDINVRKAISAAINRDNAVLLGANGYATANISSCCPGLLGWTDENAEPYNVEKAKEYMAASGLPEDQRDFTVITKEEPFKVALESVQADLLEIGINLKVELLDAGTYTARGAAGDFDMIVGKSGVPDILIYSATAFQTGGALNFNFLSDEYVDNLILTGLATLDATEREAIIRELVLHIDENAYRTGIYQLHTTRAYSAQLGGFETNLLSFDRVNKFYWAE